MQISWRVLFFFFSWKNPLSLYLCSNICVCVCVSVRDRVCECMRAKENKEETQASPTWLQNVVRVAARSADGPVTIAAVPHSQPSCKYESSIKKNDHVSVSGVSILFHRWSSWVFPSDELTFAMWWMIRQNVNRLIKWKKKYSNFLYVIEIKTCCVNEYTCFIW